MHRPERCSAARRTRSATPLPQVLLSTLWRLHGRLASARGDQSRAIALHGRALKQAEIAHDSRAIGLAHYELGQCYRQVGDMAIVREHITEAAAALHAAGDRRHLALVHSLSAVMLAQTGRYDEANAALRQAERLAVAAPGRRRAGDGLRQPGQRRADSPPLRAGARAGRARASPARRPRPGPRPRVALATLGQICVRLGDLDRADAVLHRALDVRSPIQFHETTGAVFDTLAQISLMRGDYENAAEYLRQAGEAYGAYGRQTSRWYEWSLRVLGARLATRRGEPDEALAHRRRDRQVDRRAAGRSARSRADRRRSAAVAPAASTRPSSGSTQVESRLDPRTTPGAWGEFLRLRGDLRARQTRTTEAYHDIAQSASVFDLLGERYQAALSQLALGRLAAKAGARSIAERHYQYAAQVFQALGADARSRTSRRPRWRAAQPPGTGEYVGSPADADDALVRRLVDAAVLPDLLGRELAAALLEAVAADGAVVFVELPGGDVRVIALAGADADGARTLARLAVQGGAYGAGSADRRSRSAATPTARATSVLATPRPLGHPLLRRLRMIAAVARQGFELCGVARAADGRRSTPTTERPLEPLLPGFLCASAAMTRVVEQIQRLQGNDLTVLITGESGTGKELVARAIHVGSLAQRGDVPALQLHDDRRASSPTASCSAIAAASSPAPCPISPASFAPAAGGTLFLDEIGDLPLDVQPKLLRFLEQGEIMPVGETRPQPVDVRVLAATNADLEQRVAEGKFREDLYYRLSVIRIHVPPLRERREEIPHLSTFFLREASERLGKPDMQLELRRPRPVRAVLVAGQRPPAAERDPARGGHGAGRRHDRPGAPVGRPHGGRARDGRVRRRRASRCAADRRWRRSSMKSSAT